MRVVSLHVQQLLTCIDDTVIVLFQTRGQAAIIIVAVYTYALSGARDQLGMALAPQYLSSNPNDTTPHFAPVIDTESGRT